MKQDEHMVVEFKELRSLSVAAVALARLAKVGPQYAPVLLYPTHFRTLMGYRRE